MTLITMLTMLTMVVNNIRRYACLDGGKDSDGEDGNLGKHIGLVINDVFASITCDTKRSCKKFVKQLSTMLTENAH